MKRQSAPAFSTNSKSTASKVPRPMNCFMTYRLEKQREIVERCPGANHRDISKIIAKWWKELPVEEKAPYRMKADKAKMEHKKLYPEYKFCPKKKLAKPRAYKKRPENQFTARDYQDEQELFKLYHEGDEARLVTENDEDMDLTLDTKESKPTCRMQRSDRIPTLDHEERYTLDYPKSKSTKSFVIEEHHQEQQEQQQRSSPFDTRLLYPPVHGGYMYTNSLPSQSVYSPVANPYSNGLSPSASPYNTGYYSSSEEPNHNDINYNLYPSHYHGYPAHQPLATYDYYPPPTHYYNAPVMGNDHQVYPPIQSCHPLSTVNDHRRYEEPTVNPALLTSAFYYQQQW